MVGKHPAKRMLSLTREQNDVQRTRKIRTTLKPEVQQKIKRTKIQNQ